MKKIIAVVMSVSFLAACQNGQANNEALGTLVGAGLGVALGAHAKGSAKAPTMIMGGILGGALGNRIGAKMDRADRAKHERATYHAMEHGRSYETTGCYNPDTGHRGEVTPEPAYQRDDGRYCREFQQTITVDGQPQRGYGTACSQPDGSWEIVSTGNP